MRYTRKNKNILLLHLCIFALSLFMMTGCTPQRGPDKTADHKITGALTGAGTGAVTGFQLGAGTGPGALVGAGIGAVAGGMRGFVHDIQEEVDMNLAEDASKERSRGQAQALLAHFYDKRMKWHPSRDIFPADIFFVADRVELCPTGKTVLNELIILNKERFPWSRLGVVVYTKSNEEKSAYAQHLSERRALAISNHLILSGIEARRLETRAMVVPETVFVDPEDTPDRYAQSVEFIPLDR